jgi:rhodanese-related sulfurtransferase
VQAAFPDPATKLLVGCQTGRRSAGAVAALAPHYSRLVENKDGWVGWVAAGLPVAE